MSTQTNGERAFENILQEIQIDYEREHIVLLRDLSARFIDFYSDSAKVGFEVDGGYHKERVEEDLDRDIGIMASKNILMVRFTNEDVLDDPEGTKDKVLQTLWSRVEWWKRHRQPNRMVEWVNSFKSPPTTPNASAPTRRDNGDAARASYMRVVLSYSRSAPKLQM